MQEIESSEFIQLNKSRNTCANELSKNAIPKNLKVFQVDLQNTQPGMIFCVISELSRAANLRLDLLWL